MSVKQQKRRPAAPKNAVLPRYRIVFAAAVTVCILLSVFAARLHLEELRGEALNIFANTGGIYADWFYSCKETILFRLSIIICLYAVGERIFPDHPCKINPLFRKSSLLPVCCVCFYFLMTCLSALFSQHSEVTWRGGCTEYEGAAAIFGYCILFFFGWNYVSSDKSFVFLRRMLTVLAALTAAAAVFEYCFLPLVRLPFMKYLLAPAAYRDAAASLTASNSFREAVLMFGNANYSGAFFTLIFPVSVYALFAAQRRSGIIAAAVCAAAVFAASIMTNATTALYLMTAELIVLLLYFAWKKVFSVRKLLCAFAAFCLLAALLDGLTARDFSGTLRKSVTNAGTYHSDTAVYRLKTLKLQGNSVYFAGAESGYTVTPPQTSREQFTVEPDAGTEYTITHSTQNSLRLHDTAADTDIFILISSSIVHFDFGYKDTVDFAYSPDGLRLIAQNGACLDYVPEAPLADSALTKYYTLATGRGYTWLNTLPILRNCLLLGKGPGNFAYYFVQYDVVGLCNTDGTYRLVTDKPHNWYLQIAVAAGLPALAAILVLFGLFAAKGLSAALRTGRTAPECDMMFTLCLFTGLCGYMVSGLVNDSSIAVSPVFWICFGTVFGRLMHSDADNSGKQPQSSKKS